jgi:cytochrome c oxidase subunit 2
MRGVIKVVSQEDFDMEMAKLKPNYFAANPDKDPATQAAPAPAVADTAKPATAAVVATAPKAKI